MDEIITTLTYKKVERIIDGIDLKLVEHERMIHLYPTKIVTQYREFQLSNIYDITYKPFSSGEGLLYLHTNNGVFSYPISISPEIFIAEYNKLKNVSN